MFQELWRSIGSTALISNNHFQGNPAGHTLFHDYCCFLLVVLVASPQNRRKEVSKFYIVLYVFGLKYYECSAHKCTKIEALEGFLWIFVSTCSPNFSLSLLFYLQRILIKHDRKSFSPIFFHQGTAWATSHCHPDSRPGRPCQGLLVMLTVNPSKNTIWPQTVPLKTYKPQEENAKIFETKKTIQQKQSKKHTSPASHDIPYLPPGSAAGISSRWPWRLGRPRWRGTQRARGGTGRRRRGGLHRRQLLLADVVKFLDD